VLGGGVDERQAIAHEVFSGTSFDDLKPLLLNVLKTYQAKRVNQETFFAFSRRHTAEELRELFAPVAA
jgi:ferredoxin-nitrite reductase